MHEDERRDAHEPQRDAGAHRGRGASPPDASPDRRSIRHGVEKEQQRDERHGGRTGGQGLHRATAHREPRGRERPEERVAARYDVGRLIERRARSAPQPVGLDPRLGQPDEAVPVHEGGGTADDHERERGGSEAQPRTARVRRRRASREQAGPRCRPRDALRPRAPRARRAPADAAPPRSTRRCPHAAHRGHLAYPAPAPRRAPRTRSSAAPEAANIASGRKARQMGSIMKLERRARVPHSSVSPRTTHPLAERVAPQLDAPLRVRARGVDAEGRSGREADTPRSRCAPPRGTRCAADAKASISSTRVAISFDVRSERSGASARSIQTARRPGAAMAVAASSRIAIAAGEGRGDARARSRTPAPASRSARARPPSDASSARRRARRKPHSRRDEHLFGVRWASRIDRSAHEPRIAMFHFRVRQPRGSRSFRLPWNTSCYLRSHASAASRVGRAGAGERRDFTPGEGDFSGSRTSRGTGRRTHATGSGRAVNT